MLPELLAGEFVDHSALPGAPAGIAGYEGFVTMVRTAFPDFHFELEDMVAERDRVVMRGALQGSNEGPFMGLPPTGRRASWTATHTYRLSGGKIVEHWGNVDIFGLMRQLGHIPS